MKDEREAAYIKFKKQAGFDKKCSRMERSEIRDNGWASSDHVDPVAVIARLDRAIQYSRSAFTGSPGQAGR
jgi:hypothetical protein